MIDSFLIFTRQDPFHVITHVRQVPAKQRLPEQISWGIEHVAAPLMTITRADRIVALNERGEVLFSVKDSKTPEERAADGERKFRKMLPERTNPRVPEVVDYGFGAHGQGESVEISEGTQECDSP